MKKILVVDDSAVIRRFLVNLLEKYGYEVDTAKNGLEAVERVQASLYSLVTLDIEMPIMDGIQALKNIMSIRPTRVLMVSSFTTDSADATMKALELGAIDYIPKPKNSIEIVRIEKEIIKKVKMALLIPSKKIFQDLSILKKENINIDNKIKCGYILIGASTGGPRLIEHICKSLPENFPHSVCIVQHMPAEFTTNFAKRLDLLSKVEVCEAENGMELVPSRVVIAKGGWHLHFRRRLNSFLVSLAPNSNNRFFVPSVDEMFFSAAEVLPPKNILAIELTGIGDDGADGMVRLRNIGAVTIAESEKSAVVYGMPKEAFLRGGAAKVMDFKDILAEIIRYGQKNGS